MSHPIEVLRGVGAAYAEALGSLGYRTTDDLLGADDVAVASWIETIDGLTFIGATDSLIPQAAMLRLPDCSPADAATIVDGGLLSYRALAFASATQLADHLDRDPADPLLAAWQLDAARRIGTATVLFEVLDGDGQPVAGATVEALDPPGVGDAAIWKWQTDEHGRTLAEYLNAGSHRVYVHDEQRSAFATVVVAEESRQSTMVRLVEGSTAAVVDEYADGVSLFSSAGQSFRRLTAETLDDLPGADVFVVTALERDDARLTSARYRQVGLTREMHSVNVAATSLPASAAVGTLVMREGDALVALPDLTLQDWRHDELFPAEEDRNG